MWDNKHTKHMYLPWTFRRVYRVWGLRAALRFLLKGEELKKKFTDAGLIQCPDCGNYYPRGVK